MISYPPSLINLCCTVHAPYLEGEKGVGTPLKNHKNIGFLSNTGPEPLNIHKATKPAFNVGPSSAS